MNKKKLIFVTTCSNKESKHSLEEALEKIITDEFEKKYGKIETSRKNYDKYIN